MTIVVATGGFDPLHSGHIEYLKAARKLGDWLVVGLNSDAWLTRKKGHPFMSFNERKAVLSELRCVDKVIDFNDDDNTAKDAIHKVLELYPDDTEDVIFVNGGDRNETNIPETAIDNNRLSFVFGVGGTDKLNSSSELISKWIPIKVNRSWGYYRVLHEDGPHTKVKELTVNPGCSLSIQQHSHRIEYWHIAEGMATLRIGEDPERLVTIVLDKLDHTFIPSGVWHQLINNTEYPLRVVEIQYGLECNENDIIRYN